MKGLGERWVRFLRLYGPTPHNENMYDEHINRSAKRLDVRPISFHHPVQTKLLALLQADANRARCVVLTGTAGDGKSRLCGRAWSALGGDGAVWATDQLYYETAATIAGRARTVGVIRDLTKLPGFGPVGPYADRRELLCAVSAAMLDPDPDRIFIVAANDGQLMEAWRRLGDAQHAPRVRALLENLLVRDRDPASDGVAFFNLSQIPCVDILDLSLSALLEHEGWQAAYDEATEAGFFGPECPIRRNFETLRQPLFQARLRALFVLLDHSGLHTPVRRVLLFLANVILGHPAVKDRLMQPSDIASLQAAGALHRSDIYDNVFGENLTPARRESLEIIEFLSRFGIGHETTNRIDNILIFGSDDEVLRQHFITLVEQGTPPRRLAELRTARTSYLESPETELDGGHPFLSSLVAQRRAMFFRIPKDQAEELRLWDLSVFSRAGEYLDEVVRPLSQDGRVGRRILGRLVNGLNRVFTGMLVSTDRELLLATNLSYSGSGLSQLLEERISVAPKRHERVELVQVDTVPTLVVHLDADVRCPLTLNLIRYEFLMRVASGALPGSFSRECHEDILAFKSTILAALERVRPPDAYGDLVFKLLTLNAAGDPADEVIEVADA
ncbi:hypothetical protein QO001_005587 [Methylobacterium brachiatum]|uniref:Uncharacterized protein n=1 Tax=Methylobacterium brachiatum TaxID=269660 RepID=A0AAJ1TTL7_9HYPH|nr:hypothetical protein [Methylobacterium brachiatum]MDQ0546635.1 hypothetical protein [Methylobacterium brachiatum]